MKKSIPSNPKISHAILSKVFLILFIFTASIISTPLPAHAVPKNDSEYFGETTVKGFTVQTSSNFSAVTGTEAVNGEEIEARQSVGKLFYAASIDRTGILLYIITNEGRLYNSTELLILDDKDTYESLSENYSDKFKSLLEPVAADVYGVPQIKVYETPPGHSTKPLTYEDGIGWTPTGNVNTFLNSTTTLLGEEVPRWAYYASVIAGSEDEMDFLLEKILETDSHWAIVAEPVSIQYIYSDATYNTSGKDILGHEYSAGDPLPAGSNPNSSEATPYIFCGTARRLAETQTSGFWFDGYCDPNPSNGGNHTYKFLNMSLPWSMCLDHDQEVGRYKSGYNQFASEP